ncbi:cofactor D [Ostreococcus tauri]|uniref:Cofactor D n=1 Tax=Ostreococcus tauri TaxID=70448 RepID=A0A1Y5INZ2_OSTTA|nr:cofactor D [Ostreococcus tauri]
MAFMRTLERYRERAVLLDPLLEALISPLTKTVAEEVSSERANSRRVLRCCEALDAISSLRGWKTCVRFYPNSTKYLEPAVRMLRDARTFDRSRRVSWEVQRVTLAWLSLLALVPFDLLTIDSDMDATSSDVNTIPRVVRVLMYECKLFLGDPGACRDVAAQTLAKLVTRPDMKSVLRDFMSWSSSALRGDVNVESESMFLVPGILRTLAAIYKIGRRDALLEFAESSWQDVENTRETDLAKDSTLIRQLSMKLACRVGLAFLKPRVVSWRYDRGSRRLEDNIIRGSSNVKDEERLAIAIRDDDDGDDVHVAIDGIVEICLRGLRDSETFVRWGAAKALGRIASRLPQDFADEIVGAILECFSVIENDSTWHGACLALAELARRGLLLPNRLSEVVPLCVQALTYDVRRGAHSIGAHVRDAAAYVCWALSRAYAPDDFAPFVHGLAPTLLMVACFDREVNCRRAASAAFQEAVGRLGKFPHGIDIVNFADYFSLGSKTRAALDVAPFVCQFVEYRRPLMEHVLDVKLTHWECSTRRLAARAIGILGDLDPEWVAEVGVETVLARTRSLDLPSRHGSIIALGEMLLVTSRMNTRLDSDVNVRVLNLISEIGNELIFTGEGGLLIRSATCRLIECVARAVGSVSMDAYTRDALVAIAEATKMFSLRLQAQFVRSPTHAFPLITLGTCVVS